MKTKIIHTVELEAHDFPILYALNSADATINAVAFEKSFARG